MLSDIIVRFKFVVCMLDNLVHSSFWVSNGKAGGADLINLD